MYAINLPAPLFLINLIPQLANGQLDSTTKPAMVAPGRMAAMRHGNRRFVLESEDTVASIPSSHALLTGEAADRVYLAIYFRVACSNYGTL